MVNRELDDGWKLSEDAGSCHRAWIIG